MARGKGPCEFIQVSRECRFCVRCRVLHVHVDEIADLVHAAKMAKNATTAEALAEVVGVLLADFLEGDYASDGLKGILFEDDE